MNRKTTFSAAILSLFLITCSEQQTGQAEMSSSISEILSDDGGGNFETADKKRRFIFPDDHRDHPGFKTEWWYFTGNVHAGSGREFGYQFTIFRNATTDPGITIDSGSNWSGRQLYMAHAALSDVENGEFYHDEQFSRPVLGLAGTQAGPLKVWLNQWAMTGRDDMCDGCFNVQLSVPSRGFRLQLALTSTKPVVLHGDDGLSSKSPGPGNASYYYSYTRLQTAGRIDIGDKTYSVTGESWFDHEWSTSSLKRDQAGWDWFSLQLSDNSELMLFRLRHRDNPLQDFYYGSFIRADNSLEVLGPEDFTIENRGEWRSPDTGVVYPSGWSVGLEGLTIKIIPKFTNQEFNRSFRYWEGAVGVTGSGMDRAITGHGYVELTGYD